MSNFGLKIQRTEQSNFIRLLVVMLIVGGIFIVFLKGWFIEYYVSNLSRQAICFDQGGDWVIWKAECESYRAHSEVFKDVCVESGGDYQGCLSPCRNQLNSEYRVCQSPCTNVCKY